MDRLSIKAYQHIWSAINQPYLLEHSGKIILDLLLNNSSPVQKVVLGGFAQNRNTDNAETVLVEIQNLLSAKPELLAQVEAALDKGKHDPLMPIPQIEVPDGEASSFDTVNKTTIMRAIGILLIVASLVLIPITGSFYYGLLIGGLVILVKS